MKKEIIIISMLLTLLLIGCNKEIQVSIEEKEEPVVVEPELPPCNNDRNCDPDETCECPDCQETFDCRRAALPQGEYLMKKGMIEDIAGKTVTFVNLDANGKTTMNVEGVERVIETTKFREIINDLEITVIETEYDTDNNNRIVKLKINKLELEPDEFLFNSVGSEMIVESVRIKVAKIQESTPTNLMIIDVGTKYTQKIKEGETKEIEGLSITAIEIHPRGTPLESYAILEVIKIPE